jgi:hypothetical protein
MSNNSKEKSEFKKVTTAADKCEKENNHLRLKDPTSKDYVDPSMLSALSLRAMISFSDDRFPDIMKLLNMNIDAVKKGNLACIEEVLTTQVISLNAFFNMFIQSCLKNVHHESSEKLLRLALKAQNQCRTTADTLASIKNPASATFVKQTNIGYNQQVNNNAQSSEIFENKNCTNELLDMHYGQRLDARAKGEASPAYSHLEPFK